MSINLRKRGIIIIIIALLVAAGGVISLAFRLAYPRYSR